MGRIITWRVTIEHICVNEAATESISTWSSVTVRRTGVCEDKTDLCGIYPRGARNCEHGDLSDSKQFWLIVEQS